MITFYAVASRALPAPDSAGLKKTNYEAYTKRLPGAPAHAPRSRRSGPARAARRDLRRDYTAQLSGWDPAPMGGAMVCAQGMRICTSRPPPLATSAQAVSELYVYCSHPGNSPGQRHAWCRHSPAEPPGRSARGQSLSSGSASRAPPRAPLPPTSGRALSATAHAQESACTWRWRAHGIGPRATRTRRPARTRSGLIMLCTMLLPAKSAPKPSPERSRSCTRGPGIPRLFGSGRRSDNLRIISDGICRACVCADCGVCAVSSAWRGSWASGQAVR